MNAENLVKMANQISQFFESEAGEGAPEKIAEHLKKFWDPRMRRAIVAYVGDGGDGLRPPAARAVRQLA